MKKGQNLYKIEELGAFELEDLNTNEGYSYIYSFGYPEIQIIRTKDDEDTYKVLEFRNLKTTWVAKAVHQLVHKYVKEQIKLIEGSTIICVTSKMSITDIFNLLVSLDRETL